MLNFSWTYQFFGAKRNWLVGSIFTLVGVSLGLILPWLFQPRPPQNPLQVSAVVSELKPEGEMFRPTMQYQVNDKSFEYTSPIASSRPALRQGEIVQLLINAQSPDQAIMLNDPDLASMSMVLRILGTVFGIIGLTIVILMVKGVDVEKVSRIGGLMGALSFGIPATLVYPLLYIAYSLRPNLFFRAEDPFDIGPPFIVAIFTILGIIVTAASILLYRYQARTGKAGWSWSWKKEL